jgi:hypothetical protein
MTTYVPTHARSARAVRPVHLTSHDVLHLALALLCALTGTTWGAAMAVVVLGVLAAQHAARRTVQRTGQRTGQRSVAVRGAVLAPAQHTSPLHASSGAGQAVAGP